jgi:hypothetical protein
VDHRSRIGNCDIGSRLSLCEPSNAWGDLDEP